MDWKNLPSGYQLNGSDKTLLLSCLSREPVDESPENVRFIECDWDGFLQFSVEEGLAPLLYHRLKNCSRGNEIPPSALETLKGSYSTTAIRNMELYRALHTVLCALRDNRIEVIVLKGAHLAQAVYGNIGLRPMIDLDLMVRAPDLSRAGTCLKELGYVEDEKNGSEHAVSCSHYAYTGSAPSESLEIHWNIEGEPTPFKIPIDELWERRCAAMIAGVQTSTLSPEDLLLHLCVHTSFHHLFNSFAIRSLCDIAETVRHYDGQLDWEQVVNRCRQWRATNCVYLTLHLAKELLGANVPDEIAHCLEPKNFDARFAAWAERRIFSREESVGPRSDNWGRLKASGRPLDKLNVLFEACFPPPKHLTSLYSIPLGSNRVMIYYLLHLKGLVNRQARRAWFLMQHDEKTVAWLEGEARRVEEIAVKRQVPRGDNRTRSWIEQDTGRMQQLEMVKWLASG